MSVKNGLTSYKIQPYGAQLVSSTIPTQGGIEAGNNDYHYNVFTSSGTLTVNETIKADIMLVAGGGGGGMDNGAGGGAGEVYTIRDYNLGVGEYDIVIGAGGAGAPTSAGSSTGNPGTNGTDTTFGDIFVAKGGGGGASGQGTVKSREGGQSGGSGGGGQGENYALYFIYGGLGYGSMADHQVSYHFTPALSHYITVANSSVFDFGNSTDFTISFWFNQRNDYTTIPSSGYMFSAGTGTDVYALNYTANSLGISGISFDITNALGSISLAFNAGFAYQSWNHIAITRSGDTYRLYVNGILENQLTNNGYTVNTGGGTINIGNSFEGIIKDFHMISGQALYTASSYTIPSTYPTVTANTVLLCLLDPTTEDHSQYNHTITRNGSTRPAVSAWGGRAMGSPYSFPFDKATFRSAFENTSGTYIRIDEAFDTLTSGTDPWTIECHVKSGANFTADNYIFGVNSTAGSNILLMGYDRLFDGSTTHFFTNNILPGKWQHYAVAFDGTTIRGYVDGVKQVEFTDTYGAFADYLITIGAEFDASNAGTPGNYFYGVFRNVRVVAGTALYTANSFTPPPIEDDLTAISGTTLLIGVEGSSNGSFIDNSSNNTTLNVVGSGLHAAYNYPVKTEHRSYQFSSIYNDYLRYDEALDTLTNITDPWTVEAFVQSDTYFKYDDATDGFIFAFNAAADGANSLLLNGVRIVHNPGSGDVTEYGFKQALGNEWCHLAYSYDGTILRMFIDGEKIFEKAITLATPLADCVFGVAAEFDAANGGTPGNYWYGRMRDMRFSTSCLYTDEFIAPDPIRDELPILADTTALAFRDGLILDIGPLEILPQGRQNDMVTDCFGYYYERFVDPTHKIKRYGNDGGLAGPAGDDGGGGGGGAGREGRRAGSATGGPGGDGIVSEFLSPIAYLAGGGGGGNNNSGSTATISGGLGGGGKGGVTGTAALMNTGSGGGASRISIAGAAGASGIVAIRYKQVPNEN